MRVWAALPVAGSLALFAPASAMAETRVVDDDGAGTATDCNEGAPASAFTTIQAAVNAANPLDTVKVCPGTFAELVTVNKSLLVQGARAGVDARDPSRTGQVPTESVVRGAATGAARTTSFNVTASDVTIDGFTVQEGTDTNQFGSALVTAPGISDVTIANNIVKDSIAGLQLGSDSSVIEHNLFAENNAPGPVSGAGIYSDQFVSGGTLTDVVIANNTFFFHEGSPYSYQAAISLSSTATGSQSNIAITGNRFDANSRALIAFQLTGSVFSGNEVAGYTFAASSDLNLFEGVSDLTVSENLFEGIFNDQGAVIGNMGTGGADASDITFKCNSISGYDGAGLVVAPDSYTGPLAAEDNWWGHPSGPTIASNPGGSGDKIVDRDAVVDFSPFVVNPADGNPGFGYNCPGPLPPSDPGTGGGGTGGGGGQGVTPVRPVLTLFRIVPSAFPSALSGPSMIELAQRRRGATVSYVNSQVSTTTFTVQQPRRGYRRGRRCVARRPRGVRRPRRCTLFRNVGAFTRSDQPGPVRFRFTGRVRNRRLRPGPYRLRADATNSAGSSAPVTRGFRITRR